MNHLFKIALQKPSKPSYLYQSQPSSSSKFSQLSLKQIPIVYKISTHVYKLLYLTENFHVQIVFTMYQTSISQINVSDRGLKFSTIQTEILSAADQPKTLDEFISNG